MLSAVSLILSWNIPTLILGGGGYKTQNAAKCWAAITALSLGRWNFDGERASQLSNETQVPESDARNWESYSPDFNLEIKEGNMRDENDEGYLLEVEKVFEGHVNHWRKKETWAIRDRISFFEHFFWFTIRFRMSLRVLTLPNWEWTALKIFKPHAPLGSPRGWHKAQGNWKRDAQKLKDSLDSRSTGALHVITSISLPSFHVSFPTFASSRASTLDRNKVKKKKRESLVERASQSVVFTKGESQLEPFEFKQHL